MRPQAKVLYALLLALLSVFAIQPYWPAIKQETAHFIEAWKSVREARRPQMAETDVKVKAATDNPSEPRRSLKAPAPQMTAFSSDQENLGDPFIRETRQRAQEDPEAAMRWLQEAHSGSERLRGMLEVVALWAAKDSESTLLWLESNAQGIARMETLQSGVEVWAERNPEATATWIDGMANDGSKVAAARALAKQWAQKRPTEAAEWVAGLPEGEITEAASLSLVESWAENDPSAAAVWALTQAEYSGNERILDRSIELYAAENPESAEAFVRDLVVAHESTAPILTYVESRAEADPSAAAAWFSKLDPQDPIYSMDHAWTILNTWAESDSVAASAWLSEQRFGPSRDAAVAGFVESVQRFEPEAAIAWAGTIEDPKLRYKQLQTSFKQWAKTSPQAALNWIESADLAPALRTDLATLVSDDISN